MIIADTMIRRYNTYIIFICTFGVFTGDRHKYTFKNMCLEDADIALDDDTTKLFLSTKGKVDDISKPLKVFLDYIDGKEPADELMQEIDTEVNTIKHCDEWRREYMTLAFEMDRQRREGLAEGMAKGELKGKVEGIRNLMETMSITAEQAMRALKIPDAEFAKYMALL